MRYNRYTLKEIVSEIIDYRGKTPKKLGSDWSPFGIRALSAKNIKDGRIVQEETIRYVDDPLYKKWMKQEVERGTILITSEAPFGQVLYWGSDEKIVLSQRLFAIKTKGDFDSKFIYYYMSSSQYQAELKRRATGSTVTGLRQQELMKTELVCPDLLSQRRISSVLSNIDEKIQNNNRINDNLHEICLTFYRELITGLNRSNSFRDLLKNHAKCILGGTPSRVKPDYWNGDINWINSGEINRFRILAPSEKITELGLSKTSTTLLPIGTTVLAITGATLGQVSRIEIETCANQSVIGIIPDESLSNEYVYLSVLENINDIIGRQTGGAQQHINKNDVETYKLIIPNRSILDDFSQKVVPIFDMIKNNCVENESLIHLRDTLLPELINGKINLDNIEI